MFQSVISYPMFAAVAALGLVAGCADMTAAPPPPTTAANEPQLVGAWYQIFFDTDATEINGRGQMIIQKVAYVVHNANDVRVTIIGKTDSVGSRASNAVLSQQRANRVREALIAEAVPAERIDTGWVGEDKQDVATASNVAEQRNRVVDIVVQHP